MSRRRPRSCEAIPYADRFTVAFAIGTGLRQGKQWKLELRDLHLDARVPWIWGQYGKPNHGPTKSKRPRGVPLFGIALEAPKEWLAILRTDAKKNPPCLVFPTARLPAARWQALRHWSHHLATATLGKPGASHDSRAVHWHTLRHTSASAFVTGW